MAFASVGSLGSASLKVAGADLALSPDSNVPAGNIVVIWTAWEIDYSIAVSAEGVVTQNLAVHDSTGTDNIWVTLASFMWESNAAIHLCRLRTAITTGTVITIHSRNSSRIPKTASMWEFTMDAAKAWVRSVSPSVSGTAGADLPDVMVNDAMLARGEALILHGISALGPNTDTYTFDPDYTAIDGDGTTGGSVESNVHVRGGFRITGLTSDTIVQTSDTADRAYDQVVVILGEAEIIPGFPTFPVLDNFNRADEDDLDFGGLWEPSGPLEVACTPNYGGGGLRVSGNQATRSAFAVAGAAQFWAEEFEGCYAEVFATMAERGQIGLHLDSSGCGNDSNLLAYGAYFFPYYGGTGPGSAADDYIVFGHAGFRGPPGDYAEQILVWVDLQDGWKFGLQRDSRFAFPFLHLYINRGSGWEWTAAIYDSAFGLGSGQLGLAHWGDIATFSDDFGGGYGPCPEFWPNLNVRSARRHAQVKRIHVNVSDRYVPP